MKNEKKTEEERLLDYARTVIENESRAVRDVIQHLSEPFVEACKKLASCKGRIVTTGMGKAGIIAQKISATLASTGTPSLFLHPAEALHGDLGRVVEGDVVLILSNSGTTEEVLRLIPPVKRAGATIVSITGDLSSPLARNSDIALCIGKVTEACPLGLAPSASTTAMLALGDALALSILNMRMERGDFSVEEYAQFHPAGAIGREFLKVTEVMRKGEAAPVLSQDATIEEVILA
ncbi:MAG: SIS domain-containing protein, partial [Planctomycetota bacterium]|nr:SIS domain-containing protein [Planctomycetota bacterium]